MPLLISGAAAVVSAMNRAFSDTSPSNAVYANQIAEAGTTAASQAAWAVSFGSKFTGTSADLADLLLTNTGIKAAGGTALATAVAAIIDIVGVKNVGQVAMLLSNALSTLEADATYGAAAKAWNAEVTAAYEYSANTANTQSSSASTTTGNEASSSYVLTAAQDIRNGTAGNDFFRAVAGPAVGTQDQTTLNSSDILDGLAGTDTLIVNMTGLLYQGGARLKNIETLQIGTNLGASTFDYNVNAGFNEISETTRVVYDQINLNEALTVNNLLKTGAVIPTVAWVNESTSTAGTINVNYRASAVDGTTTNQNVELSNVNALTTNAATGVLNVAGGVETLTIDNITTGKNTLNVSANVSATGGASDLVSGTAGLTKVVVTGAGAFGEDANVVAQNADGNYGLTNRAVNSDLGVSNTRTSASNLVSVANTVTEYDASAATGSQAVRFTANTAINTPVNVTFKGGTAADYVEFELGNVNATGGTGNDTFAFINGNGANSTFGESDTINGGDGADTIQLGLNGNGTYNIGETELRNKSSVGTLDLRGNTTNLTLSSSFVAGADTADSITVVTDRIVQTSDAIQLNDTTVATNNGFENASTHTVNLTQLSANQTVVYTGGSGSDRLILSDSTYNVLKTLNGGGVEGQVTAAGTTRFDTITMVTQGERVVIDAQDLSKTSNFEGFVLTKNSLTANYDITLTRAFLAANTLAADDLVTTTGYNDTVFQIGTANAANNRALSGATDVVSINVADLLNAANNALAAGAAGRTFDVTSLEAAGVTVQFVGNSGAAVTAATLRGLGILQNNGAVANINDVLVNSAANGSAAAAGLTFISNPVGAQANVLGTVVADTFTLTQADTIIAGAGNDVITLNAGSAGASVTAGVGVDTINVNTIPTGTILSGAVVGTVEVGDTATVSIDVGAINFDSAAGVTLEAHTVAFTAVQTGVTLDDQTLIVTANSGGAFTLGAGTTSFTGTGAVAYTVVNAAADATVITGSGNDTVTGAGGRDTLTLGTGSDNVVITAGAGTVRVTDFDWGGAATNDNMDITASGAIAGAAGGAAAVSNGIAAGNVVITALASDTAIANANTVFYNIGGTADVTSVALTATTAAINAAIAAQLLDGTEIDGGFLAAGKGFYGLIQNDADGNGVVDSYFLFQYLDTNGAGTVAADVTVVGIFDGIDAATINGADFV